MASTSSHVEDVGDHLPLLLAAGWLLLPEVALQIIIIIMLPAQIIMM